jgi:hypothetical protein
MTTFLKKEFDATDYEIEEIAPDLLLINNFLLEEEINEINDIISGLKQEDWEQEYLQNLAVFCLKKFGTDDVDGLVKAGKFEITQNWADKNFNISKYKLADKIVFRLENLISPAYPDLELSGFKTIQRMQEGVELKSHSDQHTDPSIQYASIIYLNDDYVDGEIFFPNKGLTIKPKTGSLLIFPGNEEFEHGVRHVGPGPIRYVLVGFIKTKNFYENNKQYRIGEK